MQIRCISCKGRGYCGKISCPHLINHNSIESVKQKISCLDYKRFDSQSPAPFIGRVGYPYINVGMLVLPDRSDDCSGYDAPREWSRDGLDIPTIAQMRSALINSRVKIGIMERNKFVDVVQESAMAHKPVDLEVKLSKRPAFSVSLSSYTAPTGPVGELSGMEMTSHPKILPAVEKAVSDGDARVTEVFSELYSKGIEENALSKLLSVGSLGVKKDRRLVPTRWSITATDDQLGKLLLPKVKEYAEMDHQAFFGGYLGNYYLILSFPERWSYELFEMYLPKASFNISDEVQFSTDYEPSEGRKDYAQNCAGAYYASRLALLEKMKSLKRQASIVALRIITGEYTMPLGVWVCREATRKALEAKPITFSDKELMLGYAKIIVKKRFGYDISPVLNKSVIIRNLRSQTKLCSFA